MSHDGSGFTASIGRDNGAIAEDELHAVVCDAQAYLEPERVNEPISRLGDVRIRDDGNDRRRRN
jgi:hypothetical protein